MRLLVLGGSWFVGSALITATAEAGHKLTVFNRGRAAATYPTGVEHVHGDWESEADVACLASRGPWDAVIDVGRRCPQPGATLRVCTRAGGRPLRVHVDYLGLSGLAIPSQSMKPHRCGTPILTTIPAPGNGTRTHTDRSSWAVN
jgi:uncharacterized protein YbjT (DUF2867 family)